MVTGSLLVSVLRHGEAALPLAPRAWERLLSDARQALLLARLADQAHRQGWFDRIPIRPRRHLEAAIRSCRSQQHTVRWEVGQIERALARIGAPVVLLKGAAYVMANLPVPGRIFTDIDIMVPREHLGDAERALVAGGWLSRASRYDRAYYERWMHELPALQHVQRLTVIDLHHTIAPPSSRTPVNARKLFAAIRPLDDSPILSVLAPADMLLHSAVHLMQEGEFLHGLRDLLDLDALFAEYGRDAEFWPLLVARAAELGLGRPLYYAVQQLRALFGTAMPQDFLAAVAAFRPNILTRGVMGSLLGMALAGPSAAGTSRSTDLARWLLYVRGHYVRMPLYLLVPHLVRKIGMRLSALRGRLHRRAPANLVGIERNAN